MTDQERDAIIAEAIEDKPEVFPLLDGEISSGGAWVAEWNGDTFVQWLPRLFISDPTCCTEKIVLERMRGHDENMEFCKQLDLIYRKRCGWSDDTYVPLPLIIANHKVQDYALALEAVLGE